MGTKLYKPENPIPTTGETTACAETTYEVTFKDLPLHCPMDGTTLWNSHPRVYIEVEETGEATCPYCGAKYVLKKS